MNRPEELDARARRLRAALAAVLVNASARELRLMHMLLDSWSGIGLIVVGMTRHGFQLGVDQRTGAWLAVFYRGSGGHEPTRPAGTAQASTPWGAVQRAAWAVFTSNIE